MAKYRIIGNMTGNSMDAVDLVLCEFNDGKMQDVCTYSKPYTQQMQEKIENLRMKAHNKTRLQIENLPDFRSVHNEYISNIADCINKMCALNNIDKKTIDAIGFHGKTLDHNPPSKAKVEKTKPYTVQMGSGQMLADLTSIPVVYDFRSDYIAAGFEGAPLAGPHNAHIAKVEGDGCYYNGGNTSNFAIIKDCKTLISSDSGPFNEYIDNYVRIHTSQSFDKDALIGKKGSLDPDLLKTIFELNRIYYETLPPKSGDPAYYHKDKLFDYVSQNNINFETAINTFEYSAAYFAFQALSLLKEEIKIPPKFILFGGGWKNPLVYNGFKNLLNGTGFELPEHKKQFSALRARIGNSFSLKFSDFGDFMEARLFADLARYKLENKPWELPEVLKAKKKIVCGVVAYPENPQNEYADYLSRATKNI